MIQIYTQRYQHVLDVYLSVDVCLALEAFGDLDLLEEELRELDLRFPISTFDFETLTLKMRPNILQLLCHMFNCI